MKGMVRSWVGFPGRIEKPRWELEAEPSFIISAWLHVSDFRVALFPQLTPYIQQIASVAII